MIDILEIINRIKRLKSVKKDYQVAEIIGISKENFNNKKKRNTLVPDIVNWATNECLDLNWLLTGQGDLRDNVSTPVKPNQKSDETIVHIHKGIVERFSDKERAMRINEKLLALEAISADALREIEERLDLVLMGAKLVTPDRRRGQRRQQNDHARARDHDRRSGRDRRKAIGER